MNNDYTKSPRLYVSNDLADKGIVPLSKEHAHYLLSVLRKTDGDLVRVFNGRHGEYVAQLCPLTKKSGELRDLKQIRPQPDSGHQIHLYFAPIKKDRLSFLIEKAVELGVTDLHPVITAHTENRKPNIEKIHSYITEAAEQCERLDIPVLHPIIPVLNCNFFAPTYAALERGDHAFFQPNASSMGICIGPEGGWSEEEGVFLKGNPSVHPVSLGERILRAETAALFMLSRIAG
tara:strand:+ start:32 stop:730 length:699 start_codon:yes stop_codon:yes gene_type:complete